MEKIYRLAASLAPIVPNSSLALFLTTDREMVFLMQTDAARHKDGTIQIHGAEMGISVLTPERLRPQIGKALMYGDALRAIGLEDRDERGAWQPSSAPLTISQKLIKELREE